MHYLHAVLAQLDLEPDLDPDVLAEDARQAALDATECYGESDVFDWRTNDAGRWADEFPRRGVVLGVAEPDQFLQLLDQYRQLPFARALFWAERASGEDWGWRSLQDIESGGFQIFDNPENGQNGLFWSARPVPWPGSLKDLVRSLNAAADIAHQRQAYTITLALRLVAGDYRSESGFYSVPDASPRISPATLQAVREHPERFALVFLDYHN